MLLVASPLKSFLCVHSWLFSADWCSASGDKRTAAVAKADSEVWPAGLAGLRQWTAWNIQNFKVHQSNIFWKKCIRENTATFCHSVLIRASIYSVLVSILHSWPLLFHSSLEMLGKHGITKELKVVLTRTPTRSSVSSSSLSTQVQ